MNTGVGFNTLDFAVMSIWNTKDPHSTVLLSVYIALIAVRGLSRY